MLKADVAFGSLPLFDCSGRQAVDIVLRDTLLLRLGHSFSLDNDKSRHGWNMDLVCRHPLEPHWSEK